MTPSEAEETVARAIRALELHRESLGVSKRQLALRAGLDPKTVGLIERGERSPTLLTLLLISTALKADLPKILAKASSHER
ncbi:MAG: helix-turn-helix domain-containing protein [Prosthecobacter sp.]|nr:helix-turn-helix domain-containing protein [Prosthecobacter sp.]